MSKKDVLDRTDCGILEALQNNARLSNKELAARVKLAPSTCLERVRRLQQAGVLRGYHAEVRPEALGIGLEALVAVRLRNHSRALLEEFQAHVLGLPETANLFHVAGVDDYLVHVMVRDAAHLRDLALDAFTARPEVAHIETSLIFSHQRSSTRPNYVEPS